MKKNLLALCLILFNVTGTTLYAQQAPLIRWQKSFGGTNREVSYSIVQTTDSGYIVAGESSSINGNSTGHHGDTTKSDFWVVKTDSSGILQWQRNFGGSRAEVAYSVIQTKDKGFAIAGWSYSTNGDVTGHHGDSLHSDFWVVKLDSGGNMQWQKSLGGSGDDAAYSIIQTKDSGYAIAGFSNSTDGDVSGGHGGKDYWVVKLNNAGVLQWQQSYGGQGEDDATSIVQTKEGGYIIAGYAYSNGTGQVAGHIGNSFDPDYWILKTDALGNITWKKCYGGTNQDYPQTILQTRDSGYIIAGYTLSNDVNVVGSHLGIDGWILKLDNAGFIEWSRCVGGSSVDYIYSIFETGDGYAVSGTTISNDGDVSGNPGHTYKYWVFKMNTSGSLRWQHCYGGTGGEGAQCIVRTGDGGYAVTGSSISTNGDVTGNHGGLDYWVVKLNGECQPIIDTVAVSICPGHPYSGHYSAGTYIDTFTASSACDSIRTLHLTLLRQTSDTFTQHICAGDSTFFAGTYHTAPGYYPNVMTGTSGCDSIRTLHLIAYSRSHDTISATICTGDSILFHSSYLHATGLYAYAFTNIHGCDSIVTLALTVNSVLHDSLSHSICTGGSYSFHGQNLTTAGTYHDTLTSAGGCDSIVTLTLTVNPLPAQPHITRNGPTLSVAATGHLQWFYDGLPQSGDTSSSITITQNGLYTLEVTDANGCSSFSDTMQVAHLSLGEINSTSSIYIYPNPATESFTLSVNSVMIGTSYTFTDITGRMIHSHVIEKENTLISLNGLSSGIYILQIDGRSYKVVKE